MFKTLHCLHFALRVLLKMTVENIVELGSSLSAELYVLLVLLQVLVLILITLDHVVLEVGLRHEIALDRLRLTRQLLFPLLLEEAVTD